jgi:4-hydroxy 2-oxovalerate aldolase
MKKKNVKLLDCTLRDGGYYNSWDFSFELINEYLQVMHKLPVDYVEIGFRSLLKSGFKGGVAYTTEKFLDQLNIPKGLNLGVMINASEIIKNKKSQSHTLSRLFVPAKNSKIKLVRVACHMHEFKKVLPCSRWLKKNGYKVGFNLMQISERKDEEIKQVANLASKFPIDVLYFADSLGSMSPARTSQIINLLKSKWRGELGIHTHDNMGRAMVNSMQAISDGVNWIDSTVTGMGRGPGNLQTEYSVIEIAEMKKKPLNIKPLISLIEKYFEPLQSFYKWGKNPYYYLSGKNAIHPSFVQEMLTDSRYDVEDLLSVINKLSKDGGEKFSFEALERGRNFYQNKPIGSWSPFKLIRGRDVLIIGSGESTKQHKNAIESFVNKIKPFVIALNAKKTIKEDLINIRVACHPFRIMSDFQSHHKLPQPLAIPKSMLPKEVISLLKRKKLLDFGISIKSNKFNFEDFYCTIPSPLALAYALAIATGGKSLRVYLAGFDGYSSDDPRTRETNNLLSIYKKKNYTTKTISITNTKFNLETISVYSML